MCAKACFMQIHVLTESLYGTVALLEDSESGHANDDITLSKVIRDLSTSAAVEQLSVHCERQEKFILPGK